MGDEFLTMNVSVIAGPLRPLSTNFLCASSASVPGAALHCAPVSLGYLLEQALKAAQHGARGY